MTSHAADTPPFLAIDKPLKDLAQLRLEDEERDDGPDERTTARPSTPRRSTEPSSSSTQSPYNNFKFNSLPSRPRNRSPYSRSHLRTRSSASSLSAPPMTRAHSSPVVDTFGHIFPSSNGRPASPAHTPGRHHSPLRSPVGELYSSFGGQLDIDETIAENQEMEFAPRPPLSTELFPSPLSIHHTFPRSRRRPSSPLHNILQGPLNTPPLHSSSSSPTLGSAARYNEPYPSNYSISSSSMPSTPTSFRSRSPSISSLETIPDSPDAEQAAQEADTIARLKAAADKEIDDVESTRRRGTLDVPGRGGLGTGGFGVGNGTSGRDKRKRWSVCGAERRGDLNLDTIWED